MTFDPYAVLGLAHDADPADIRRAYRRIAKTAHPDTGGDPGAFEAVKRAHDVLADPERRARYDATGEADDVAAQNPDAPALAVISAMIVGLLSGDAEPGTADIVAQMVVALDKDIAGIKANLPKLKRAMERAHKLRARFHRRDAGENVLHGMLDWNVAQIERAIAATETEIKNRTCAKELLADYRFERELPPPLAGAYQAQTGAQTGFGTFAARPFSF